LLDKLHQPGLTFLYDTTELYNSFFGRRTKSFMHILLISMAGCPRTPADFIPDNGLALLAAGLARLGHTVEVADYNTPEMVGRLFPENIRLELREIGRSLFDGRKPTPWQVWRLTVLERRLQRYQAAAYEELGGALAERVKREKFDWVGFKLWNGDGFTASLTMAACLKKELPRLPVFGGGPQVDIFRDRIFEATGSFDALIYGEGEPTLQGLNDYAAGRRSLASVPNLIFKSGGSLTTTPREWVEDLNLLPMADYRPEVYPALAGGRKLKLFVIDESRGCPYHCHFCIHPVKSGRPRRKSARAILAEMESLRNSWGATLFRYAGSNTPADLLEEVADALTSRGLKIEYTAFSDLRKERIDFDRLRASGCYALFFGVESTDPTILDERLNKQASPEEMERLLKEARAAGIFTVVSLIVPNPGETEATKQATLEFLERTRPDSVAVQFPGVIPNTEWARDPARYGFGIRRPEAYARRVMNYKIRLFFPPRFWDPLPYRVDGKPFRVFARETEDFIRRVEARGFTTLVTDEYALMSRHAGLSPVRFRDICRRAFFTGDADALQALVDRINENSRAL